MLCPTRNIVCRGGITASQSEGVRQHSQSCMQLIHHAGPASGGQAGHELEAQKAPKRLCMSVCVVLAVVALQQSSDVPRRCLQSVYEGGLPLVGSRGSRGRSDRNATKQLECRVISDRNLNNNKKNKSSKLRARDLDLFAPNHTSRLFETPALTGLAWPGSRRLSNLVKAVSYLYLTLDRIAAAWASLASASAAAEPTHQKERCSRVSNLFLHGERTAPRGHHP